MELVEYFRFVFALMFVLGMIGACAYAAKRFGLTARASKPASKQRLSIIEVRTIDAKRKLVLLGRDEARHLVLLGGENDLLIESNIQLGGVTGVDSGKDQSRIIPFIGGHHS